MSDCFDHAADAWDDAMFGRTADEMAEPRRRKNSYCVTCKECGATELKWRTDAKGNWRLYENARVEHNRLKPHVCVSAAEAFRHG